MGSDSLQESSRLELYFKIWRLVGPLHLIDSVEFDTLRDCLLLLVNFKEKNFPVESKGVPVFKFERRVKIKKVRRPSMKMITGMLCGDLQMFVPSGMMMVGSHCESR
ncbi:uncharacterized protein LOC116169834 [Photinus pyralis]|uniref:uncharacterized protein LOC116169834 n=1 Tax=Photinus pyralis TaxID=7054 RepID=UPI001266F655|nr:uncharacterized protein LOC116169834 [Photinus pyralis]